MAAPLPLADVLGGLSIVADLGFGLQPETAMGSSLMGTGLARELGVAEADVADTFYTSLLLHIGCTAFAHEAAAAMGESSRSTVRWRRRTSRTGAMSSGRSSPTPLAE
jgi:hypothetical protein